jgi:hypothetical protein
LAAPLGLRKVGGQLVTGDNRDHFAEVPLLV